MKTIYLAVRVPEEFCGAMQQVLGVSLDRAQAEGLCHEANDAVIELEAGRLYPPGEVIAGGVPIRFPHCASNSDWQTSKCLGGVG